MAIERLRLKGFKSFGSQFDFDFAKGDNGGFTAIVGPNGSGKSNILDALRYVLGESSSLRLRITRLSDLLFQGSATMPPAKEAEVGLSLSVRNNDGKLERVNIKRHYETESGSAYSVDGTRIRLQDLEGIKSKFQLSGDDFAFIGQGTVAEAIHQRPKERRAHLEILFGIDKYRKKRDETADKLKSAEGEMQRIQTLINELNSRRDEIAPEVAVAVEAQGILDNLENLRRDYYFSKRRGLEKKISDLDVQLAISQERDDALKNWARIWQDAVSSIEERHGRMVDEEQKLLSRERELNEKKDSILRSCYAAANNIRSVVTRRAFLLNEEEGIKESVQKPDEELINSAMDELNKAKANLKTLEEREKQISVSFTDAFAATRKNAGFLNQVKREISEIESQIESLRENSESEYPAPERMLLSASRLNKINAKIEIAAEVFSFKRDYLRVAPAIEIFLGRRRFYLLVHTMKEAQEGIEHLKSRGAGRATFLPLERARPRFGDARFSEAKHHNGVIGWAGDLITVREPWLPAIQHLLGDLLIVERYDVGSELIRKGSQFPIATVEGDIFSPAGTVSGGSMRNKSSLGQHGKIQALEEELASRKNSVLSLQKELEKAEAFEQKLSAERSKINSERSEIQEFCMNIERKLAHINGRIEQGKMSAEAQRKRIEAEREELNKKEAEEHSRLSSLGKNYYLIWLELKDLLEKISAGHEAARNFVARSKLLKLRSESADANVRRGIEIIASIEEKGRGSRNEIAQLSELWDEKYPYNRSEADSLELEKDFLQVMRKLERELKALGNYNLGALSEDESLLERTDFLTEQLEDSRNARDELDALISQTDKQVETLFVGALDDIDKRFNELFRRLFGGGEARLQLQDGDTIWDRGVEIFARPPGKQLHNIAQLSGGEQSLTAIAHLFSSLEVANVPLAVLDEVDAALDEYNLIRFADLAKEYSKTIQLLVMTHRRTTMERADLIYGVTMVEPGLSHIVGINMEEYQ